jgi:predicted nucleic acid-binding protein
MLIVDTNLVVALVIAHPLHDAAKALLTRDMDWHLPDWWQIELANALRNYHRAGLLDAHGALAAVQRANTLFPPANTHPVDLIDTLRIACEANISAYDARFIALARSFRLKLVTEDTRLRKACPADTLSLAEDLRDEASPAVQEIVSKKFFGKRKKGEVTPHTAYYRPILEALVEMGGSGKTKAVLNRVGEKMKGLLKPLDYETHKSDGKSIRWRNSAQWARNAMVNDDGRMKKSPNGIWDISEMGRRWLSGQR